MKSLGDPFMSRGERGDTFVSDLGDIFLGLEPMNCKKGFGLDGRFFSEPVLFIGWFGVLLLSSAPDML